MVVVVVGVVSTNVAEGTTLAPAAVVVVVAWGVGPGVINATVVCAGAPMVVAGRVVVVATAAVAVG